MKETSKLEKFFNRITFVCYYLGHDWYRTPICSVCGKKQKIR